MPKMTVEDVDVAGKKVLVRVDFNVPINADGTIGDDSRVQACLPTIKYLMEHHARIILCSHFGRPEGKVVEYLRLAPIAERLSKLLSKPVEALRDCIGSEVKSAIDKLANGEVILLENLRFHPEEEANDTNFAQALAELADIYVNDAFGASHRSHASVVGIAEFIPAISGFLMGKELSFLSDALENPERPFAAVVGGAKLSGKLGVLENIIQKVDILLIGGGMAATFIKSQGYGIGTSIFESDKLDYIKTLVTKAESLKVRLLLPQDVVVTQKLVTGSDTRTVPVIEIPDAWLIADIGPTTIKAFSAELRNCRTVVWNGPMGVYEIPQFAKGTHSIARVLAETEATTVIGGGSTAETVIEMGLADKISHVSTGGGASLEFLEGKILPGVAVLQDKL